MPIPRRRLSTTPTPTPTPTMPRTLLFDLDGTLTDSAPGITRCIAHALERHGLDPVAEERLRACVGPPLADSFRALSGGDAQVESLISAYRERYVETGLFENTVYEGVETLLDALIEHGIEIHVVTAKPGVYAERVLEHFDLRRRFGGVHGPELDGSQTAKAELIETARHRHALDPARTVMIGDRGVDMSSARAHGMGAWGVRWGYGSDDELRAAGAQLLVDRPVDVLSSVLALAR